MDNDTRQFFQNFERKGESLVRIELPQGMYGKSGPEWTAAHEWLRLKEESRIEARISRVERRADRANTIAIIAAITAIVSMITTIIIAILK